MYQDFRRQYYWSGMKKHVGDFVRQCLTCQQVKAEDQKSAGLLQPLRVAEWKWEHVTMDFVTHFPRRWQGYSNTYMWEVKARCSLGDSRLAHEVDTFLSCAEDLHTGGIFPVVYPRDRLATWSASVHSVGQRLEVYDALLEEFPKGHGHTTDHEYTFPPIDKWSI